jgi:hypothetical protein
VIENDFLRGYRYSRPTTDTISVTPTRVTSRSCVGTGTRRAYLTIDRCRVLRAETRVGHREVADRHPDPAARRAFGHRSKGYFEGTRVGHLQLVYGKLPDGYKQTVPSQSHGALPLALGVVYGFFAETTNAPGFGGSFYLTGSGPTQIDVPGLCLRLIERRDVAVKCGTNEPDEEPTDLAKFAREHQITP